MKRSAPRDLFWLWDRVSSFIYKNTIELWVMETENNQNVFSVFITHNSKIRELSYGNRVIVWPNNLFTMGPIIFELWVMETENWVMKFGWPNSLLLFEFFLSCQFSYSKFECQCNKRHILLPPIHSKESIKIGFSHEIVIIKIHK